MAAIVERPMSVLNDMQTPGASMEIIDVDAFEDEGLNLISNLEAPSSTTYNPRPVSRPLDRVPARPIPPTIYLLDSDDDDLLVTSGSGLYSHPGELPKLKKGNKENVQPICSTNLGQPSSSRRILSPPPRNVPVTMIPPVPAVPPRFAGQTSFPMRLQPPPFPSPPVRPTSRPFPFEDALDAPIAGPSNHRHHRRNDAPAPQAAPPSHHTPSMGLGGAIISSHRLGNSELQTMPGLSRASTRRARMPSFTSRLVDMASFSFRPTTSSLFLGPGEELDDLFGDDEGGERLFGFWRDVNHRRRQTVTQEKELYLSSYTHPFPPDPGFTFDFALPASPTDDTYRRTRLFPPTSINNPIVLDDDDDSGNQPFPSIAGPSSSTSDTGKVTATLVCANCSDLLLINAALLPNENDRRVWGLRCGHIIDEKCLNLLGQPPRGTDDSPDHIRGKGKGKAKVTDPGPSYGDTVVSENQTVEAVQENNIRSRLRSRPAFSNRPSSDVPPPSLKRRRVSNKKKKVEEEYLWRCPVANCGREHVSVKVDGVWGPEKERESVGKSMGPRQLEVRGAVSIFA